MWSVETMRFYGSRLHAEFEPGAIWEQVGLQVATRSKLLASKGVLERLTEMLATRQQDAEAIEQQVMELNRTKFDPAAVHVADR